MAEQGVETPWPIEIEAHDGSMYNVLLKVGESLIYESARLAHSRATPLDGEMYANAFVHFMPTDYDYYSIFGEGRGMSRWWWDRHWPARVTLDETNYDKLVQSRPCAHAAARGPDELQLG